MTMTSGAEMKRASTAACPITTPPTVDSAFPMPCGIISPASRRSSKAISIKNVSKTGENGTPSRAFAIERRSGVGSIS